MYFPYLYDRQAEKLALIDVAPHLGQPQVVFPLIEPCTGGTGLTTVIDAHRVAKTRLYVVVNPDRGALKDPSKRAAWFVDCAPALTDDSVVTPVFKIGDTTIEQVENFLDAEPTRTKALLVASTVISPKDLATAVSGRSVLTFLRPENNPLAYAAALGPGATIDIEDSFPRQERNADYPADDWFSATHTTFGPDGRPGFSDFTVLSSELRERGFRPGAVAIHLTWENGPDELRVQHFLSDERDQAEGGAGSKILEALEYVVAEVRVNPVKFRPSTGLTTFQSLHVRQYETNLTKSKQHQISHHIYTVAKMLGA